MTASTSNSFLNFSKCEKLARGGALSHALRPLASISQNETEEKYIFLRASTRPVILDMNKSIEKILETNMRIISQFPSIPSKHHYIS